jgi:hypothetical protein
MERLFYIRKQSSPNGWFVSNDRGQTVSFSVGNRTIYWFNSKREAERMIRRAFPGALVHKDRF